MHSDYTVSALVIRMLQEFGVRDVWGYPGGSVLNVYDALYNQKPIKHFLTKGEQAAILAASTSYKDDGAVGVCVVTSGPGITNSITGITTANSDSIPILILSGQVPVKSKGKRSFQECDAISLSRACVKRNFPILKVTKLEGALEEAYHSVSKNRPAPILLDFPKDVSKGILLSSGKLRRLGMIPPKPKTVGLLRMYEQYKIRLVLFTLLTAQRPLFYIGGGASDFSASKVVRALLQSTSVPHINTLMGINIVNSNSSLGMIGMHGQQTANLAMYHCDLLIAIGSRFDDRVVSNIPSFNLIPKTIILFNADVTIRKGISLNLTVKGDLKKNLGCVLNSLKSLTQSSHHKRSWLKLIRNFKTYYRPKSSEKLVGIMRSASASLVGSIAVSADVGQHQMIVAKNFNFNLNCSWFSSGGLGTMGSSLPFAIGAATSGLYHNTLCFCGDGSFFMSANELETAKQLGLSITTFVFDNKSLGMVKQWQQVEHLGRYSQSEIVGASSIYQLSESYGHFSECLLEGEHCNTGPFPIEMVNQKAYSTVLIIEGSRNKNVWPMVQSNKSITNMLLNHKDIS
ncbi:acetolactate synthase large subunit [Candidatus Tremblaya phenacola PAVE]|nr:acetolactate synthase large subunit [Candidatus Tremblaya phenacola PAVE]